MEEEIPEQQQQQYDEPQVYQQPQREQLQLPRGQVEPKKVQKLNIRRQQYARPAIPPTVINKDQIIMKPANPMMLAQQQNNFQNVPGYNRASIMALINPVTKARALSNSVLDIPLTRADTQIINVLSPQSIDIYSQPLTPDTPISVFQSFSVMPGLNSVYLDWMARLIKMSTQINPLTNQQYKVKYKTKQLTYYQAYTALQSLKQKQVKKGSETAWTIPSVFVKLDMLLQIFAGDQTQIIGKNYKKILVEMMLTNAKRLLQKLRYNADFIQLFKILTNQYAMDAHAVAQRQMSKRLTQVIEEKMQQCTKTSPLSTTNYAEQALNSLKKKSQLAAKARYEAILAQSGQYISEKSKLHKGLFALVPKDYEQKMQQLYKKFYINSMSSV